MPWQYITQAPVFGWGRMLFPQFHQPQDWIQLDFPCVPEQYTRLWGVAFGWLNSDEVPGTGYSVIQPGIPLYNKRNIYRLPLTPSGRPRLGLYITQSENLPVCDVIIRRWVP